MSADQPHTEPGPAVASITLDDLLGDLLWTKLLAASRLALGPGRMGIAVAAVVGILLLDAVASWILGGPTLAETARQAMGDALARSADGLADGDPASVVSGFVGRVVDPFQSASALTPWKFGFLIGPFFLIALVGGGAISRMAACEFSLNQAMSIRAGLSFSGRRLATMAGAVLGPLAVVGLLLVVLAAGGWLMLGLPIVNLIGSVLYGLAIVVGALAVVALVAYGLGASMIVPAVVCEGTDAVDAVSRAYAMVFAGPVRLVLYLVVLVVQGAVALLVLSLLAGAVVSLTAWVGSAWTGESVRQIIQTGSAGVLEQGPAGAGIGAGWLGFWIGLWSALPGAVVLAYLYSYCACGSTLLYLVMRRIADGQGLGELWSPGQIEAAMQAALQAREHAGPDAGPDAGSHKPR